MPAAQPSATRIDDSRKPSRPTMNTLLMCVLL
jgi:hypothetical protein